MEYRQNQQKELESDPQKTLGDVTTVNLTQLKVAF